MAQVEKLCDSICLINDGRAVLAARCAKSRPTYRAQPRVVEFEGSADFLKSEEIAEAKNYSRPRRDPAEGTWRTRRSCCTRPQPLPPFTGSNWSSLHSKDHYQDSGRGRPMRTSRSCDCQAGIPGAGSEQGLQVFNHGAAGGARSCFWHQLPSSLAWDASSTNGVSPAAMLALGQRSFATAADKRQRTPRSGRHCGAGKTRKTATANRAGRDQGDRRVAVDLKRPPGGVRTATYYSQIRRRLS